MQLDIYIEYVAEAVYLSLNIFLDNQRHSLLFRQFIKIMSENQLREIIKPSVFFLHSVTAIGEKTDEKLYIPRGVSVPVDFFVAIS